MFYRLQKRVPVRGEKMFVAHNATVINAARRSKTNAACGLAWWCVAINDQITIGTQSNVQIAVLHRRRQHAFWGAAV